LRTCVGKHLPAGRGRSHLFASTEDGVTSINYFFRRGSETDLTIFKSAADAEAAEKAEARLGDAHDRRVENVLYSGGRTRRARRSSPVSAEPRWLPCRSVPYYICPPLQGALARH